MPVILENGRPNIDPVRQMRGGEGQYALLENLIRHFGVEQILHNPSTFSFQLHSPYPTSVPDFYTLGPNRRISQNGILADPDPGDVAGLLRHIFQWNQLTNAYQTKGERNARDEWETRQGY